jgi:transcriptional regulator with XRE-family HTH domain
MTPEELRAARAELKCTARELSAALELPLSTVQAWERGDEFPTLKWVERIRTLVAGGPAAIPRKAKGADTLEALHDPEVWSLIRKILAHPRLRAEVQKLAGRYDDP